MMKNASTDFKELICNPDRTITDLNKSQAIEHLSQSTNFSTESECTEFLSEYSDHKIVLLIRDPATRFASALSHDVINHNKLDKLIEDIQLHLTGSYFEFDQIVEDFRKDFYNFDLIAYLHHLPRDYKVIPIPAQFQHLNYQVDFFVEHCIGLDNTTVFEVNNDLRLNVLDWIKQEYPDIYQERSEVYDTWQKHKINSAYDLRFPLAFNNIILPYLQDPKLRRFKIYQDYKTIFQSDIDWYAKLQTRFHKRPSD